MTPMQRTVKRPLERMITRMFLPRAVAHHYVTYDSTTDSFLENPQVRRKESSLALSWRSDASQTALS